MKTKDTPEDVACLLTYFPATYPSPLPVSTAQTPVTGLLNTAAINEGASSVYCNQVLVAVPVGPDANELFANQPAPTASCNTSKWAISSLEIKTGTELGLDNDIPYATFTFDCRAAADYLINYNLVFGVQGQMTQTISECTIQIMENSGTTSDPNGFTQKRTSYTVQASTPQFYLMNFVATVPTAPTVPATDFANGADIQFSWESNGTFFQLYQKNVAQPIYSGTQTTFKLAGGVSRDTTFFLVGMMTGNPGGDSPIGGYQPIYLYDALTITISNPDMTPRSSTISGNASVGGTLGVTGQTTLGNANVGGTFGVTGQATLGNANVGGTLGVTGQTTLGNATVGGTLSATGQTNLANANVSGTLGVTALATLMGGLQATANFVSLFTGAQGIGNGSYTAKTDGFVVGRVTAPNGAGNLCIGWIAGSNSDGVAVNATGGNIGCFDSNWTKAQASNNQGFLLPVRKGTNWTVGSQQASFNQAPAGFNFWWVPLGSGSVSAAQTFEKISDEQPELNVETIYRNPLSYEKKIKTLLGVIEDILEKKISRENQRRLLSALLDLQVEDYSNEQSSGS